MRFKYLAICIASLSVCGNSFSAKLVIGDNNTFNNPYVIPEWLIVIGEDNYYEQNNIRIFGSSNSSYSSDVNINGYGNYIGYGSKNGIFGSRNSIQHVSNLTDGGYIEGSMIFGDSGIMYAASNSTLFGNRNIIKSGYKDPSGQWVFKSVSDAMVFGNDSKATSTGSITIGSNAYAGASELSEINKYSNDPSAILPEKVNDGENSIAIGNGSVAVNGAIALGEKSVASVVNSISVGDSSSGLFRKITNVDTATDEHDAVNFKMLKEYSAAEQSAREASNASLLIESNIHTDTQVAASGARMDSQIKVEQNARDDGDTATLHSANEHTDNKISASNARTDSLITVEQNAREAGDAATYTKSTNYTDLKFSQITESVNSRANGLIEAEKSAREAGDVATLVSANAHTDSKISASDARTDSLIVSEQQARDRGDAATLKDALKGSAEYTDAKFSSFSQEVSNNNAALIDAEKVERDNGDIETLSKSTTYTDSQVRGFDAKVENVKIQTGSLLEVERTARKQGQAETLQSANNYTDSKIREMGGSIRRVERKANAGISGAIAMSSIPYSYTENMSFGMGVGSYRGEQSLASGIQFKANANTNVRVNVSWDSQGSVGAGAGFAIGW
ncbi:YadA-like family protein [Pectobacterium brasiliense]|uniref:YadA-like family protein n=1 Tax=Pectobacterium brasiliense TaxID=180957 RepID=UPI00196947A1|nr:YadA-like family protein [Pectobacterium brasiliense]